MTGRGVDTLKKIRGPDNGTLGLRIIKVVTSGTAPTFVFEGGKQALDLDIFEIPVACYPLKEGDRLLVYPLVDTGAGQRWAAVENLNGGLAMATMQGPDSLIIDGVVGVYGAADLIIPPYFAVKSAETVDPALPEPGNVAAAWEPNGTLHPDVIRPLKAADRVSVAPTWSGGKIKYVILQRY